MNVVNRDLSFVIFDGSTHYVVDRQEMELLISEDQSCEVVYKSFDLDKCQDKADELNELL